MEALLLLDKFNKTYSVGDIITGNVQIACRDPSVHISSITVFLNGIYSTKSDPKQKIFAETKFINLKVKVTGECSVLKGINNTFPFKFPIYEDKNIKYLESYHGVLFQVNYWLYVEVHTFKGALESKKEKIFINVPGMGVRGDLKTKVASYHFNMAPETLNQQLVEKRNIPKFNVECQIDNINCDLNQSFNGFCIVHECSTPIKSIELQFLRNEFLPKLGLTEESEIQNLQIGDGDVIRDIEIPLFMLFPKNFCCANQECSDFKVSFEICLHIVLINAVIISYTVPLNLWRSSLE